MILVAVDFGGYAGGGGLNGECAVVSTLAGGVNGTKGAFADASGTNAGFNILAGVAVDASGNVFVTEWNNQRVRKVTASGGTRMGPVNGSGACASTFPILDFCLYFSSCGPC